MTTVRVAAGGVAFLAALLVGVGCFLNPRQAAFSYLVAVLFLVSLAVGALFWVLLHYLTGAVWSVSLRRLTEHMTSLVIPAAVLFLPLLLGMGILFEWSREAGQVDAAVAGKSAYLNMPFFVARAAGYFVVWLALMFFFRGASLRQDRIGRGNEVDGARRLSAFGMLLLALTTTFAAFDWIMSLDPHWYSNIFGVYFWSGSILSSLAAVTLLALAARRFFEMREVITVEHLHDLGKLLFGFTVFWAYIAFSQYFLIWYAAIPEETTWYARRLEGSWSLVTVLLGVCHFVVPFALLLPRPSKRSPLLLGLVAAWILVCHGLDLYWQVMPTLHPESAVPHWLDVVAMLLILAVGCGTLSHVARMQPLIPQGDPDLPASIRFESE
jgi:hypothetical protein